MRGLFGDVDEDFENPVPARPSALRPAPLQRPPDLQTPGRDAALHAGANTVFLMQALTRSMTASSWPPRCARSR